MTHEMPTNAPLRAPSGRSQTSPPRIDQIRSCREKSALRKLACRLLLVYALGDSAALSSMALAAPTTNPYSSLSTAGRFALFSATDDEYMEVSCNASSPDEADCHFYTNMLRVKSPDERREKARKLRESLASASLEDLRQAYAPPFECKKMKRPQEVGSPRARLAQRRDYEMRARLCAAQTREDFATALLETADFQEKRCAVSSHQYRFEFRRFGKELWRAVRELPCNGTLLITLEYSPHVVGDSTDPTNRGHWTFKQTRVPGTAADPGCDVVTSLQKTVEYSSRHSHYQGFHLGDDCSSGLVFQ